MFEPRVHTVWITQPSVTFLGGTPEFDLWYFGDLDANDQPKSHLRIVNVDARQWDVWYYYQLPPKGTGVCNDITLTPEQEESIETYLRCFVPWVLGRNLTEENNDE